MYLSLLYVTLLIALIVGAVLWFWTGLNATLQKLLIAAPVVLFIVWLLLVVASLLGVGGPGYVRVR